MAIATVVVPLAIELLLALNWAGKQRAAKEHSLKSPNVAEMHDTELNSLWEVPWESYKPDSSLNIQIGDDRFIAHINSHGFRTHEFTIKKPAGTIRIVCLGGSTTFQGRSNEETYPAILEAKLREKYPKLSIEVLNLGISGVQSGFWLSREDELFELQPDIVLQYEGVNDIAWRALPAYSKTHTWATLARTSRLVQRLFPFDPAELDREFGKTIENQRQMAELCRKHGAAHIAGSFAGPDYERAPVEFQQYLDVNTAGWTQGAFPLSSYKEYAVLLDRYNDLFEQAVRANQMHGPMIHREITGPDLFIDLCHFTQEGIVRLANAFLPAVSQLVESRQPAARQHASSGIRRW